MLCMDCLLGWHWTFVCTHVGTPQSTVTRLFFVCFQVQNWMTLQISRPSGLPHHCSWGRLTCWTTFSACVMSCLCSFASAFSQAVREQSQNMVLFYVVDYVNNVFCGSNPIKCFHAMYSVSDIISAWWLRGITGDLSMFVPYRDPIHVPWPALPLLLSYPGQRLSAVGWKHGRAAGYHGGNDPLHDQSELLPPWQSTRIPGLEESSLCWR